VINEKGLYVGLNFALTYDWNYGLQPHHMLKLIAQKCSTTKEAIELFRKVPLCYPKLFFIADKSGEMAVIEHTSKEFAIRKPENKYLIMSNMFFDPILKKKDQLLKVWSKHLSIFRLKAMTETIPVIKDNLQFKDIIKIMSDKKSGICVEKYGVHTNWNLCIDLKNEKYYLYYNLFNDQKKVLLKI